MHGDGAHPNHKQSEAACNASPTSVVVGCGHRAARSSSGIAVATTKTCPTTVCAFSAPKGARAMCKGPADGAIALTEAGIGGSIVNVGFVVL